MANLLLVKNTEWDKSLVSDGQIAFIAQDTDEGKNILYAQGEYFGDSAKSNKVSIKEKITVAGGPLAESVAEVYPEGIPEGTTLQEILVSLLCKEIFPQVRAITGSVALNKGTITFTGVPSGFVEVGTKGNVQATGSRTTYNHSDSTIIGLTYGYDLDGEKYDDTAISVAPVVTFNEGDNTINGQTFSLTSASFVDINGNDIADTITIQNRAFINSDIITKFGENEVSAVLTNKSANYTIAAIPDIYPYSNLGNKGETSYSVSKVDIINLDSPGDTTSSKTWTGAYPVYIKAVEFDGTPSEIEGITVNSNTPLTKCEELNTSITLYAKFPGQAASGWDIAIPDDYSDSTAVGDPYNTVSKEYSADARVTFVKTDETGTFKCGTDDNTEFTYTIYRATGTNGANGVKLTINLK